MFTLKHEKDGHYTMHEAKHYTVAPSLDGLIVQFDSPHNQEYMAPCADFSFEVTGDDKVWVTNSDGRTVDRIIVPGHENNRLGQSSK